MGVKYLAIVLAGLTVFAGLVYGLILVGVPDVLAVWVAAAGGAAIAYHAEAWESAKEELAAAEAEQVRARVNQYTVPLTNPDLPEGALTGTFRMVEFPELPTEPFDFEKPLIEHKDTER